ncbi:MAG: tyrosine-type recombinase/integrase [Inhella sp.]
MPLTTLELTKKLADAKARITAGASKVTIQDGDGLMLVVLPTSQTWVLRRQVEGDRRDKSLGKHPAVGLKEARRLAVLERELPMAAQARPGAAAGSAGADFETLFEEWIRKGSDGDVSRRNKRVAMNADVLPAIGKMLPHQVHRSDIDAILRKIEARGALDKLRRVRMWMSMVYEYAIDSEQWPLVVDSPVRQGKLRSFAAPVKGHYPAVTDAREVPALMRAILLTSSTMTRHALQLSAYLWQRPAEIREAVWSEFDLDAAVWRIPAGRMKLGREHWVPLPRQAVQLLRLHQSLVGKDGLLFPGRVTDQPLSEMTLQKRLRDAGYGGRHTPHGFRAMGRTLCAEVLGIEAGVLEKHLSHEKSGPLGSAYDRAEYWPQRVAMIQRWADWLDAQQ